VPLWNNGLFMWGRALRRLPGQLACDDTVCSVGKSSSLWRTL